MCCLYPCFRCAQRWMGLEPDNNIICMVIVTEIIRWFVLAVPIFLAAWRYAEILQYTIFIPGMDVKAQYWLVTTLIFLGASIVIYLPLKIITSIYWKDARYTHGWRPSIVTYIIMCALPCLIILLYAIDTSQRNVDLNSTMDSFTTASIQACVMGLTITEWMAKMREEHMTFDLTYSMSTDFFFAYDVIDFFMLSAFEPKIYHSPWFYITFIFGYISMFKYIPNQPTQINENGTPKGAVTCILVSMFCSDIPFLVVRVATMAQYGLQVSDIIHPAKNVAMIILGMTQLYIIYQNYKGAKKGTPEKRYSERRCARHSSIMGGTLRGTLACDHVRDQRDFDCNCEDIEQVQPAGKVSMRERRSGSGSRVSPTHVTARIDEAGVPKVGNREFI